MTGTGDAVPASTAWTLVGPHPRQPRPSMSIAALALLFAWPVMVAVEAKYPAYMIALAFIGAGWCTYTGIQARALVSALYVPVAMLWLNPLLGADWFTHEGPVFFLAHSAMALLFGTAAYTYMATEKR